MILLIVFFALFGFAVDAQTLPERYSVTNVASDDVLNIRAEPDHTSEKIGELGPFTLNVEVLRTLNGWGYIGAGERSGWVSMRYLAPNPTPANELPRPLSCGGTEPFWDITFWPRGAEYNSPETGPRALTIASEGVAENGYLVTAQQAPDLTRTIAISGQWCSDGMSDRNYGMSAILFTQSPNGNFVQTGCCTMQIN